MPDIEIRWLCTDLDNMKRLCVLSDALLCSGDMYTYLASLCSLLFLHVSRFVCDYAGLRCAF